MSTSFVYLDFVLEEFMPNGSLNSHLFHNSPSSRLNLKTCRYQITIDISRGIAYLHRQCRECIIHCNIKPENTLLDYRRGTMGYLTPEWITCVAIIAKDDVYSYRMVMLEIISGRRNLEQTTTKEDGTTYFPMIAASKLIEGDTAGMLDGNLRPKEVNMEELDRACKIAYCYWCIQDDEIGQVIQVLKGIIDVHTPSPQDHFLLAPDNIPLPINFFFECSSNPSTQARNNTTWYETQSTCYRTMK